MNNEQNQNQSYDALSVLTLITGILSAFWFVFLPIVGGLVGIVGIVLASIAKQQDDYNQRLVKWGRGISLVTGGMIAVLLPLTLLMEFVKFISS
ncbi:hypothetical protein [Alkalicoccobacillus gibsonii]|jgi:hypothetical protein|uniref:hypothetical protein n=1 Tax=Alkalicoccobacillus gibsonii TaxID=79881 RepID=UPI0019348A37|nr:hypothetical protein [Alkalicoccobacillus gibsonii]MBM0064823.1 hypothetical protein [Alkalicoccobacillus gibsonii]